MHKAWLVLVTGLVLPGGTVPAQEPSLPKIGTVVSVDPASVPIKNQVDNAGYGERWRVVTDLNFDGIPDLLISDEKRALGSAGGNWQVYLGIRHGKWRFAGTVSAHPMAMNLHEQSAGVGLLTIYWHGGASEGTLASYKITFEGIRELPGKTIHPGDGGTAEGNRAYKSYFSDRARLHPQSSQTDPGGKVTWLNNVE